MKKIYTSTKAELDELYNGSALTWEGLAPSDESLEAVGAWMNSRGAELKNRAAYITSGKLMNETYGLTGDNAYPDDLHIVSFKLSDLTNIEALAIARFEVGGRWFDDIVDNNADRERRAN